MGFINQLTTFGAFHIVSDVITLSRRTTQRSRLQSWSAKSISPGPKRETWGNDVENLSLHILVTLSLQEAIWNFGISKKYLGRFCMHSHSFSRFKGFFRMLGPN